MGIDPGTISLIVAAAGAASAGAGAYSAIKAADGPDTPEPLAITPKADPASDATRAAAQRRRDLARRGRESLIIEPAINRTTTGEDTGLVIAPRA